MVRRSDLALDFHAISSVISYEPDSGLLRWKKNGLVAGYYGINHYVQVRFSRKRAVLGHRLAWLLHYGSLPAPELVIDHINRDKHDNRISNLRAVSHSANLRNSESTDNGGVCLCKQTGRWKAYYVVERKQIWLGRHDSKELAIQALSARRAKV